MIYDRPYLVLVILIVMVPLAFATSYIVAVLLGDVTATFPYISETGTLPPTSCIFGQFLDIGAALTVFVSSVRYLHLKLSISVRKSKTLTFTNKFGYFLALMSCLGVTIVGNFQVTNVKIVHYIGAILAFFSLLIYFWIQTFLSKSLSHFLNSSRLIFMIRLLLCILATITLILTGVFGMISAAYFKGNDTLLWKPNDGGYVEHILSTSNEWLFCLLLVILFATFIPDFTKIKLVRPEVRLVDSSRIHVADEDNIAMKTGDSKSNSLSIIS